MTTLTLEADPIALTIVVTETHLIVDLADGRQLSVPLLGTRVCFRELLKNARTGKSLGMALRSNGPIWMNISNWKD